MTSLQRIVENAALVLPSQGLVTEFRHRHPLSACENLPFEKAARLAATRLGCQPFLSEKRYRHEMQTGRIREADLRAVLKAYPHERSDEALVGETTWSDVRLAMLLKSVHTAEHDNFQWQMEESRLLENFHDDASPGMRIKMVEEALLVAANHFDTDRAKALRAVSREERHQSRLLNELSDQFEFTRIAEWDTRTCEKFALHLLWRICRKGVNSVGKATTCDTLPVRHRDLLLKNTGQDADLIVHRLLVNFCAAFLDQGIAHTRLPEREQGFYLAFINLYGRHSASNGSLHSLSQELLRLEESKIRPLDAIHESLELLGVSDKETSEFITASLWALRGWAGRLWYAETNAERVNQAAPPGSLLEFLAIRLILDRLALAHIGREHLQFNGPLSNLRKSVHAAVPVRNDSEVDRKAFVIFQLAQILGWRPVELLKRVDWQWATLAWEIERFRDCERRHIYQRAYERRFHAQALSAISDHVRHVGEANNGHRFQAVFCCNEREEVLRRHIEEIAPDAKTFGVAGHFGLAMYYRQQFPARYLCVVPVAGFNSSDWKMRKLTEVAKFLRRVAQSLLVRMPYFHFQCRSQHFLQALRRRR